MAKEKTKKTRGLAIAAGVLAAVIGVGAVVGVGYSTNWFRKTDEVLDTTASEEESTKSVMLSSGESKGIQLLSATGNYVTNGDGNSAEYVADSITLVANYNSDATNPTFTWTCTDTTSITITPSSDTKMCTVTCSSAFSTQATITCTANDSSAYATCTLDYIKRATDSSLTLTFVNGDNDVIFSSDDSTTTLALPSYVMGGEGAIRYGFYAFEIGSFTPTYGTGTITETYTAHSVSFVNLSNVGLVEITDTDSLCFDDLLYSCYGIKISDSTVSDLYNAIVANPTLLITFGCEGDVTGKSYAFTYNLTLDPSNLYTAVSSVSLSNTAIAF